ncbi:DUF397 domain-containing protein [Streptomyces sp. UNOB3_S3]|uniref:DUF397 domain-containing protein n=1 Tax=Streptomyces sp. UNOB3_S3 TaxID=2871682 RepID=UPI001E4588E8|nr:DUF397 domain-containing protein [Streptomyces sp. UNOB3_S3]MCC3777207.1 DUF397 domain-containing protein [Streptomyces sp. UNOB3_S3]
MGLELSGATWRKSTYSTANDDCLEVADPIPGHLIPVRDSKTPAGPALLLPAGAWATFVRAVGAAGGTNET